MDNKTISEAAKEYAKQFYIRDKPFESDIVMGRAISAFTAGAKWQSSQPVVVTREFNSDEYYWCKCETCGWEDSSEFCEGCHAIADTGDHTDPLCPICGSSQLEGNPVLDVPHQYEGVKQIQIPLDLIIEPYKKAIQGFEKTIDNLRFPASQPVSNGMEDKCITDYDLSSQPEEVKEQLINSLVEITAKKTMELFYSLGLKTHIDCRVFNDATNEQFVFSFKKVFEELPAPVPTEKEKETWNIFFDGFIYLGVTPAYFGRADHWNTESEQEHNNAYEAYIEHIESFPKVKVVGHHNFINNQKLKEGDDFKIIPTNQSKEKQLVDSIENIDEYLSFKEDIAHGEEGKLITTIRGKISEAINNYNNK